ncbi:MAG: response regulator [Chlorobi bacterium]|nr:response regulator [Chlorobiota bacterium]
MNDAPLILIVDDNTWMQRIVAKIVASYGWEPLIARDGYEGIACALEHIPDAVILDLIMPDLTGMQVLRLLKRLPQTADIPVLILSVATEVELLMDAMKCGAAGFIRKPFTRSTIYEKVRAVLESPQKVVSTDDPHLTGNKAQQQQEHEDTTPHPLPALSRYKQFPSAQDEEEFRRWLDSI